MSYRDDVDTLYTRAIILQKELDHANEMLARREEELIALRGRTFTPAQTSPGMRTLRELPDPDAVLARLVDASGAGERKPPPVPQLSREHVLARLRERLDALDEECLVVIGTIIEELGDEAPTDKTELLERLRPIAEKITASYWRRH